MSTLLAAWSGLGLMRKSDWSTVIRRTIAILLSLPLLAIDIGYLRDGYGLDS
jgi:hypothetical protein